MSTNRFASATFAAIGDKTGTVEKIGIRSTQLRGTDRTLVTVPNAQFADMQIVNWARCDEMLINETIGLRYETTADQMRFFLANLREMLHAHPRINNDTVRVRFSGYGDSSLNVTIRVYAKTREWNDFHAIREDLFLRIYDLVNEAGSGFAFPRKPSTWGGTTALTKMPPSMRGTRSKVGGVAANCPSRASHRRGWIRLRARWTTRRRARTRRVTRTWMQPPVRKGFHPSQCPRGRWVKLLMKTEMSKSVKFKSSDVPPQSSAIGYYSP